MHLVHLHFICTSFALRFHFDHGSPVPSIRRLLAVRSILRSKLVPVDIHGLDQVEGSPKPWTANSALESFSVVSVTVILSLSFMVEVRTRI